MTTSHGPRSERRAVVWSTSATLQSRHANGHALLTRAAVFGSVLLLSALLLVPGLLLGPSIDAAVFLSVGRELADGATPYAGAWDHKPPGIHLLALLGYAFVGDAAWVTMWVASVVATAALAILLFEVTVRVSMRPVAAAVALYAALVTATYAFALGGGMAETFAAPLALGAVALSAQGQRPAAWVLGGALIGTAATFALLALAAIPAILVLHVGRPARVAASLAWSLVGFAAVAAGVVATLALIGALHSAVDAVVTFNQAYVGSGGIEPLLGASITRFFGSMLPLVILAFGAAIGWKRIPPDARVLAFAAAAWLATAMTLIILGRQVYGHYLVIFVPPLAILAAVGAVVQFPKSRGQRVLATSMTAVTVAVSVTVLIGLAGDEMTVTRAVAAAAASAASEVRDVTDEDDRILVWGNAAAVYIESDRRPSSPHLYLAPLMTRGYTNEDKIRDEVTRLCARPPALIVDGGSLQPGAPGMPPLLVDRPTLQPQRRVDLLDPLRAVVAEHYRLIPSTGAFLIYEIGTDDRPLRGDACAAR